MQRIKDILIGILAIEIVIITIIAGMVIATNILF